MKGIFGSILAVLMLGCICSSCRTQVASMQYDGRRTVTLSDGTQVKLLQTLSSTDQRPEYYYLPANLHLSRNPDGTPQFLFLKYTTEERASHGGVQGALMHFLMEYGLTQAQQQELERVLKKENQAATVLGAAPVEPDGETSSFKITSATLDDKGLTKTLVTSGKAPIMPGDRVACAANLSANGAQLLAATFEDTASVTDVSLTFNLAYATLLPAVEGSIKFNWSKLEQHYSSLKAKWDKEEDGWWIFSWNERCSYEESRRSWDFLVENNIVEMSITKRTSGELENKIIDAFFQMFLDSMTQKEPINPDMPQPQQSGQPTDDPKAPGVQGDHYRFSRYSIKSSQQMRNYEWNLTLRMPYREVSTLTGNLRSWYNNVKDNPKCVASVNLNDPFFTHRDIKFILDLDAKEMFDEAVNYCTVNVRKKRPTGNDFERSVTIDAKFLKDNGVAASLEYARGDDQNSDLYEYQTQWSLKGGNVYPSNPGWQRGSWEGVTLAPPVKPMTIEFEGDIDEMKQKDLTRATLQVHYYQFGKEAESNIQISPAKSERIASKKIFLDRDQKSYAYRVIFNHKTQGKLVGPWVRNVSDEYVYASIPEDLLTTETYKERAKSLVTGKIEEILNKLAD